MSINLNPGGGACGGVPPAVEPEEPEDYMSWLPNEVLVKILQYLPPSADASTLLVNKKWCQLVLEELRDPALTVFGKKAWDNLNFTIEGEIPPIPERIGQITRNLRHRLRGKEEAPEFSLILMPKGLTLNRLKEIVQSPKSGNSTNILAKLRIFEGLGDKPIKESYWLLITKDVIEGSRGKDYQTQKNLVKKQTKETCALPTVLEASVCCLLNYVAKGVFLFGRKPKTYTRCQEQLYTWLLTVGGFDSDGLRVYSIHEAFNHDSRGVSASRKFFLGRTTLERRTLVHWPLDLRF